MVIGNEIEIALEDQMCKTRTELEKMEYADGDKGCEAMKEEGSYMKPYESAADKAQHESHNLQEVAFLAGEPIAQETQHYISNPQDGRPRFYIIP